MNSFSASEISTGRAMDLVMKYHYSQRVVGCTKAFGLFVDRELLGCCCFSIPASYTLCKGVCGDEFKSLVYELSRLVVTTTNKNAASYLIGASLRLLDDRILVSYADCNDHVGHVGYVYQATNWLYTGNATAEPKWLHPSTGEVVSYTRRHIDLKASRLGLKWTELIQSPQRGKHRYVTFSGCKKFRKRARKALRYSVSEYPKGPTQRFINESQPKQRELF